MQAWISVLSFKNSSLRPHRAIFLLLLLPMPVECLNTGTIFVNTACVNTGITYSGPQNCDVPVLSGKVYFNQSEPWGSELSRQLSLRVLRTRQTCCC